ncbi:hypothetical protein BJ684DRAFT_12495, partial [Piptocephalis cylindrospora]
MTRAQADFRKLFPFLTVLVILPESIPFLLLFAPGLVPSTCILPSQNETRVKKIHARRNAMSEAAATSLAITDHGMTPDMFLDAQKLAKLAADQGSSLELTHLADEHISAFCRFLGLSDFGGRALALPRLQKHFLYLKQDDE